MMSWSCFPILVLIVLLWSSISSLTTTAFSDHLALLAFKEKINDDPLQALSFWNDSIHYCNWNGITCSHRHRDRVTVLDLKSRKLEGTLSPHIGNLSFLREIRLGTNYFHGPIPQEIGRLSRLKVLSLETNSFSDEIPTNLSYCSKLQVVNLTRNSLVGRIPIQLTFLLELSWLDLSDNQLEGRIPSMLGNLTTLTHFDINTNNFIGSIPEYLCHIQSLEHFCVGFNKLTGTFSSCLYNLSHMTYFSIAFNQLDGSLPSDIGLTLPNLKYLLVGGNKLKGLLPLSLPNASRLEWLGLVENQFIGHVPRNLGMLQGLRKLVLLSNQLVDDLDFITSLTNCTNLEVLNVCNNYLKGPMPNSIGNFSTKLRNLNLGSNQIYGSIPASIGNLVNLRIFDISNNSITGEISKLIGVFPQMVRLQLGDNEFSGQIPDSFYRNSTQLLLLNLGGNKLHGKIPPSLPRCQSLLILLLSNNRLKGTIPKQLHLPSLFWLDLSCNALSGPLPSKVGNLTNLVILKLFGNKFSGSIPTTLGNCLTLEYLTISQNLLTGSIPQSLSALKGIKELNLSRNKLSGEIPRYLENFTSLIQLDLSYNDLEGSVPKVGVFVNATALSLAGNSKLCGGIVELKLPPCWNHKKVGKSQIRKVVMLVIVVSICLVVLLCLFFVCYRRRVSKAKPTSESLFIKQFTRITYAELLEATNRFSVDNLIGIGSFGSVYKAILSQVDTVVAVKVINLQQHGAFKSFLSECNALKNLRHRNLLKIITACSGVDFQGNDFKALVFEFMPNGSLEEWLHPERSQQHVLKLNFLQRLNIAIDVASALDYLHNHCQKAIVHCDLKPSNILLDDDMMAHVADFGLAKIFSTNSYKSSQSQGSSIAIKGSIGYVAPEYGVGGEVSMHGDVYSYGIVLLEMFTGKKPTDDKFQNGQNLHRFAKMTLPEQVMNIVDVDMLLESTNEAVNIANQSNQGNRTHKCLVSVIRLGVTCSAESPVERMNIAEVVTELHHIKDYYEGVRRDVYAS